MRVFLIQVLYWYCFSSSSKKPEFRKKHNILESIPVFISYTHLSQSRSAMICSATLRRDVLKTPDCVPAALRSALSDSIRCTVCRRWRTSEWKSLSQGHHDSVFFQGSRGDKNESDFFQTFSCDCLYVYKVLWRRLSSSTAILKKKKDNTQAAVHTLTMEGIQKHSVSLYCNYRQIRAISQSSRHKVQHKVR